MGKRPSMRIRRAEETNSAVERILSKTNDTWAQLGQIPEAQDAAVAMRRGVSPTWSEKMRHSHSLHDLVTLGDAAAQYAVVDLWRKQGRIAYDIHPEVASALYRSDLKGKLPGGLFSRLPHINPLIPLPRPWPFKGGGGHEGVIRAYFLTGRTGSAFCPTTDGRSEGLNLMPWIDFWNEETGEYDSTVTPSFALPAIDGPFSLDDVISSTNAWHGTADDGSERKLVKQIIPGALSLLTYLCTDNRDLEEPPPAPTVGKRQKAPPRDPFYVRAGWHIGPKLHADRMRAQGRTKDGISTPSGVEYGPQHRAGHFKTIRRGPKLSESSFEWIDPYWTKLDQLNEGEEPATAVVPVDVQQKDPAGQRDIRLANLGTERAEKIKENEKQQRRESGWDW